MDSMNDKETVAGRQWFIEQLRRLTVEPAASKLLKAKTQEIDLLTEIETRR